MKLDQQKRIASLLWPAALSTALAAACGDAGSSPSESSRNGAAGSGPSAGGSDSGGSSPGAGPFAAQPDTSAGLVNTSADLNELLEHGTLRGACDNYRASPDDARLRLLCGKAMFFYEGFGTAGVPEPLVTWLLDNFSDQLGPGFSELGMVPDPFSEEGLPLGMAPGAPLGSTQTLAFTCASCHFARLPDGRYSVGAPNHDYDYGAHNLSMVLAPALAIPGGNPDSHHPAALEVVQPLRDQMAQNPAIGTTLLTALLPLLGSLGGQTPGISYDNEGYYASWQPGTMDFFIEPLPFDDGVHTISKISALWGLPTKQEQTAAGMPHAMLGWTGGTHSLSNFAREFVYLGGGDAAPWGAEDVAPLVDYIYSLRAPDNPNPPAPAAAARGGELFQRECISCHGGPRASGTRTFSFEEIGTDAQLKLWSDPDLDGVPNGGITFEPGETPTHAVKSPRLVGLWAMKRFLHNGSVASLESLLCLHGERGLIEYSGYGDGGHEFGCDLPEQDRQALVAYLLSQ